MTDHVTAHDPPAKNRVNEAAVLQGIAFLLDTLTFRERKVLEMRYGLGGAPAATLEVIGEQIGLTRERVRQIEVEALRKLQLHSNARTLEKRA